MHYYQFNIADYRKHTHHLSLIEHAVYRSLIDTYYMEEGPLCDDLAKIMRTHCIRSADEKQALENVLNDFFILKQDGYHHDRCDKELSRIYEKSEKARRSAEARWSKKDANAMRTVCDEDANDMLPNNPIPNNPIDKEPSASSCPHQEIIQIYNETLPELQQVIPSRWNGEREKALRARWREDPRHQDLEFWRWYFSNVRNSDWHMGRSGGWQADMGWLIKQANFNKMVEKFAQ